MFTRPPAQRSPPMVRTRRAAAERARVAGIAFSKLSGDEQGVILGQLRNALEPRLVMYFSSASKELRALLPPPAQQQLRADYEEATALCVKMGMRDCRELREATRIQWWNKGLTAADLATLAKLDAVLPALKELTLCDTHMEFSGSAGPDGVQRLAEGLVAGSLPAVTLISSSAACTWATQAPQGSPPPWTEAPCRGSRASDWSTPPSATRRWRPSRRPCGGGPRWSVSTSGTTRSATRASPPSWRRRLLQARRRRRLEG